MKAVEAGTMSPTAYVEWALNQVESERERAKTCLDDNVASQVVKIIRKETGVKVVDKIVRRGDYLLLMDIQQS